MSIDVSLSLPELDTAFVRDVCMSLARYNARTWRCGPGDACLPAPWDLRYAPPGLSGTVRLYDAVTLFRLGIGACGSLAAAYYGFLWNESNGTPELHVQQEGEQSWHVWVTCGRTTYDPMDARR